MRGMFLEAGDYGCYGVIRQCLFASIFDIFFDDLGQPQPNWEDWGSQGAGCVWGARGDKGVTFILPQPDDR